MLATVPSVAGPREHYKTRQYFNAPKDRNNYSPSFGGHAGLKTHDDLGHELE